MEPKNTGTLSSLILKFAFSSYVFIFFDNTVFKWNLHCRCFVSSLSSSSYFHKLLQPLDRRSTEPNAPLRSCQAISSSGPPLAVALPPRRSQESAEGETTAQSLHCHNGEERAFLRSFLCWESCAKGRGWCVIDNHLVRPCISGFLLEIRML